MQGTERKPDRLLAAFARRPVLRIFVLFMLWSVPGLLIWQAPPTDLGGAMLREGAMGLLAVLLLARLNWWRQAGFGWPADWRRLWVVILPSLLPVAAFRGVALTGAGTICLFGLLALLAAFHEEAWHRGILLRSLVPTFGAQQAVAVSSIAFGLFHLVDILAGQDPIITVIRAVAAGIVGYIFAAVRLRTGSVWPGMLVRWLVEMAHYLGRGGLVDQGLMPGSARSLMVYGLAILVVFGISVALVRRWHGGGDEANSEHAAQAS